MERKLKATLTNGRFQGGTAVNSARMRAVKSRGNKSTERRCRAWLVRAGVRGWKVHPQGLPGNPDFYFPIPRLAIFVDGCFWHGCPLCGHVPKANHPYWKAKIEGNRRRDQAKAQALSAQGIQVLRFWEHELRLEPARVIATIKTQVEAPGRSIGTRREPGDRGPSR